MARKTKKNKINITVGPVWAQVSDYRVIYDYLRIPREYWQQGRFAKRKVKYRGALVNKRGFFFAGYVPRVLDYLTIRGYDFDVNYNYERLHADLSSIPELLGRDYQVEAVAELAEAERGMWVAAPRAGKTYIMAGLAAAYHPTPIMIVVHTIDILHQMVGDLRKFFPDDVGMLGGGEDTKGRVLVTTRQSVTRRLDDPQVTKRDVVLIDEADFVSSFDGGYAKLLRVLPSTVRLGLTGTANKKQEVAMVTEGLLGPIIGETDYEMLIKLGFLVKPRMKFIRLPDTDRYKGLRGGYAAVYNKGVVNNRRRNMLIAEEAVRHVERGKAVLVMVEQVEHGENVMKLLERMAPGRFIYLHGNTDGEVRDRERLALGKRERLGVVATRIWTRGVTLPALDVVINAVGGDSETAAIQRFFRAMGAYEGKGSVLLVDFIDVNHEWFQKHSLRRICYYSEWGWL